MFSNLLRSLFRIFCHEAVNMIAFHFRILELKNDMVLLEHSEYHYFDDVLSDLKLTPVPLILLI